MNEKFYKRISCRQCSSKDLSLAIKLNPTPLANNYLKDLNCNSKDELFPLDVFFCNHCKHLQLLHVVDPKILYRKSAGFEKAWSNLIAPTGFLFPAS